MRSPGLKGHLFVLLGLFEFALYFNRIAPRPFQDIDVRIRFLIVHLRSDPAGRDHHDVVRRQIVDRRLGIFHRQFRQRLVQKLRGFMNGGADCSGRVRSASDRSERKIGVAQFEFHLLKRQAELLR